MGKSDRNLGIRKMYANIGKLIASSLSLNRILEGIMKEVVLFFNPRNWSLLRYDENSKELFFVIAEGIDGKYVENVTLKPGEGIAGTVAATKRPVFVADAALDRRFTDKIDRISGFTTKSVIAVPLVFRKRLYGVLELINRFDESSFSAGDLLVLQTIADFAAIAFANAMLYEQALSLASTDPLTGLLNRGQLDKIIAASKRRSSRRRRDSDREDRIIAVVADIDDFKRINDTYGHRTGDDVLRETAARLRSCLRSTDMAFRTGGDEFLALIEAPAGASCEGTIRRIERTMREQVIDADGTPLTVRSSLGFIEGRMEEADHLIHRADLAMYDRKQLKKEL